MRRFALALLCLLPAPLAAGPGPTTEDAPLRAVHFADRDEGWAVGDAGTVLHTIDGGMTWEPQRSGTLASLRAVSFVNPFTGWAVGREELPTGGSAGVVIATSDGGNTWTPVSVNLLPGLCGVTLFDDRNAVVVGEGRDALPTGAFRTVDGGRNWKPVPGPRGPGWTACAFDGPDGGVLAGPWGRLATLRGDRLTPADVDPLGARTITCVRVRDRRAVAVGQGGALLVSRDSGGVRWGFGKADLPPAALEQCDFRCVSWVDRKLWAVGSPGTIVMASEDDGETWQARPTGWCAPLHAVHFVSHEQGWAVGDLGAILTTTDAGRSWRVQRAGGQRAALLALHADAQSAPLEALAALSREGGYLCRALELTAPDPEGRPDRAWRAERVGAAVRGVGGSGGDALWRDEELVRQLVFALRVWKPAVLLADAPESGFPADRAACEAVKEAFRRAADPASFPEQIDALKLAPWAAGKCYLETDKLALAPVKLDHSRVSPVIGDAPRHLAARFLPLVGTRDAKAAQGFRLLVARGKAALTHSELMQDCDLAPGGTARREVPALTPLQTEQADELTKALQNWQVIENVAASGESPDKLIAHLAPALKKLPMDHGARAAATLARRLAASGRWPAAREAYLTLVDRYPGHPLSLEGYRWLAHYHSSGEARRRVETRQFLIAGESVIRQASGSELPGGARLPGAGVDGVVAPLSNSGEAQKWLEDALAIEPRLSGYGPSAARDPSVQFALQAARRKLGRLDEAKKWYAAYLAASATPGVEAVPGADPWRDAAAAEVWVLDRSAAKPSKPLATARATDARPHLDGKLDDACWADAQVLALSDARGSTAAASRTTVRVCWDAEHVYFAIECRAPGRVPTAKPKGRPRDPDLSNSDRVTLTLDIDRDYATAYRFDIDHRGFVAEDCWGDRAWNPKWYVAAEGSGPDGWSAEAAIPLSELSGDGVRTGDVWALNATRTLPGRGLQAWGKPADAVPRPEGMGLLQFVSPPGR